MNQEKLMKKMNQEKLIELVRENNVLYNMAHKKYSDTNYKEKIWGEIAKTLNETAPNCRRTWCGLRDSYRRAVKRKKEAKSGQAATKYKKWKYEEEMSFLEPYMTERATKTSLNVDLTEDLTEETTENDSRVEDNMEENPTLNYMNTASTSPKINVLPSKYCKKPKVTETASSTLMKFLIEEQQKEKKEQSAIRSFFSSMADTVEKFTPCNQHKAKTKIFSIVSEIEYGELCKINSSDFRPISSQSHTSSSWENNESAPISIEHEGESTCYLSHEFRESSGGASWDIVKESTSLDMQDGKSQCSSTNCP